MMPIHLPADTVREAVEAICAGVIAAMPGQELPARPVLSGITAVRARLKGGGDTSVGEPGRQLLPPGRLQQLHLSRMFPRPNLGARPLLHDQG
jgi:hypothetical protein